MITKFQAGLRDQVAFTRKEQDTCIDAELFKSYYFTSRVCDHDTIDPHRDHLNLNNRGKGPAKPSTGCFTTLQGPNLPSTGLFSPASGTVNGEFAVIGMLGGNLFKMAPETGDFYLVLNLCDSGWFQKDSWGLYISRN